MATHATFGTRRGTNARAPGEYLRARGGRTAAEGALGRASSSRSHGKDERVVRKARLVTREECERARVEARKANDGERNWIFENKREAMETRATRASRASAEGEDDRHVDYGKVPEYLVRINREREEAQKLEEETRAKNILEAAARERLPDDERQSLITGLRRQYDAINASYQKLPLIVDTPSRRARKEEHEMKLARIERDIETLSARIVFVRA